MIPAFVSACTQQGEGPVAGGLQHGPGRHHGGRGGSADGADAAGAEAQLTSPRLRDHHCQ